MTTARKKNVDKGKILLVILCVILAAAIAGFVWLVMSTQSRSSGIQDESLSTEDSKQPAYTITMSFTGDVILGKDENADWSTSFNAKYEEVDDPSYFVKNLLPVFQADDATIVDVEGTLTERNTPEDKEFRFKAPPEYVNVLVAGDVQAGTLANNHSHDYGTGSYEDTIEVLEDAGIAAFGYDRIAYLDVHGVKVGLVGTYALAAQDGIEGEMVDNIEEARDNGAQIVVVCAHWGVEKSYVPEYYQIRLGHAAIDAGADLVVGCHPHVLQGYEEYDGHYIFYSMGNFCFGGNVHPYDMDCYVVQQSWVVDGDDISLGDMKIIPCSVSGSTSYNDYQPRILEGDDAQRVFNKIEDSNNTINNM